MEIWITCAFWTSLGFAAIGFAQDPDCKLTGCVGGPCVKQLDGRSICVCQNGYVLSTNDNMTCLPKCPNKPCRDGTCYYTMKMEKVCVCRKGYVLSKADPSLCVLETEAVNPDPCKGIACTRGQCVKDARGRPMCKCDPGYILSSTVKTRCIKFPTPAFGVSATAPSPAPEPSPAPALSPLPPLPLPRAPPRAPAPALPPFPPLPLSLPISPARLPQRPVCNMVCENGDCQWDDYGSYCQCYSGYQNNLYDPSFCELSSPFDSLFNAQDPYMTHYILSEM